MARLKGESSNSFEVGSFFETLVEWGQELRARHTLTP
jgi:hypothetical protein